MDYVDVAGLRIGFRRSGVGTPLVLLHGAVCDGRVWRVQLESFADEFTVVAWDAPGCGGSADPPPVFRMNDFADALSGLLDVLDVGPAHVLGHSWGSTLALKLYLRRPSAVRSLVLVGAYAGWAGSLPPGEVEQRLRFALHVADLGPDAFEPSSMRGLFSNAMPPERAQELTTIMRETRPAGTRTMALALADTDLREALPSVTVPTLVLCGEADERSPLSVGRELHSAIPGSHLAVLPGLGHVCYLESAAAFDAELRGFLIAQS